MKTSQEAKSIDEAFRPAFEEISRRSSVARTHEPTEATYFSKGGGVGVPFNVPGQAFALLSLGTPVLAPVPRDATRPALRVYGAFASRDEAVEHAEVVRRFDAKCSLVVATMREWVLFPTDAATRDDPERAAETIAERLRAHAERDADASARFFERSRGEEIGDEPTTSLPPAMTEEEREDAEAEAFVYKPPTRIAGGDLRGQSVFALAVLPDDEGGACMVQILACFENTPEADAWVRDVGSREITNFDVHVAQLCEWIFPNARAADGRRHYRVDELQRIMDAADENPKAVQEYKKWKAERDQERDKEDAKLVEDAVEDPTEP